MALACASLSPAAPAAGLPAPIGLRVDGGEETWRADRRFALRWSNPPGVAAVRYLLRRPDGSVVGSEGTIGWAASAIDPLIAPSAPGAYSAEVRLEDDQGSLSPAAIATLRFDDARPGDPEAIPPPAWIGRASFPFAIRLGHPAGPEPLSGIRGYAVSIDRLPDHSRPCAAAPCEEAEIDLHDGVESDGLDVAGLPEGVSYLHWVAVSGAGMPSATVADTRLRVDLTDPATELSGAYPDWTNRPVALRARATDGGSGMAPLAGSPAPFTAIRIDGGAPIAVAGDRAEATVIESGVHSVAYYARDAAGNVDDGGRSNGHADPPPQTAVVKIDREPPALRFAAAQSPSDPELILAPAADPLSGVDPGSGSIGVRAVGSRHRFEELPTTVLGDVLRARWDSSSFPAGEYEFRARASDRAGNVVTAFERSSGAPMRLSAPLKLAVRMAVDSTPKTLRYGRGASYGGRLLVGRRTPLRGAELRVVETFAAGATRGVRATPVRTDARGRFRLPLAPGPSRQVEAVLAATATTRAARSEPLAIEVDGRLRLRASAKVARVGGAPVLFSGRVATEGARVPEGGKAIELQFRLPGLPWREFRTVRSDGRGRFRYAYRFADDDSRGVRFQFRAFATAQAGWPFGPAGSAPVTVRGA